MKKNNITKGVGVKHPPIRVNNLKSAKRLLSRLIYELQSGAITSQLAKDLTYLLNVYVTTFKTYENEVRLTELEDLVKKDGGYGS